MRNKLVVGLVAVGVVGFAAACGDSDSTPTTVVDAPTTSAEATTTAAAPPAAPSDAEPKRAEASGDAALTVTDIRIGHHDGFDRVVYELGGTGTPGWVVEYTDAAVQDGSGAAIDVAGQSVLEVRITGSAYPFDSGVEPYSGPDPATDPSAPGIAGVYRATVFEGITQSFIGVNGDRPAFAVSTQSGPTRLVIDIATS
ncbi:AMIN-like domain-containing (lipo)protein [Nocardia cyriacigeorgica]|uniref:AMIN-like domain-containing (lipo)protein n=1 Tax=Nocardia cyriacigeorgica TaxID=135487 RepID=UPI002453F1F7|nr:hypothetical protein [Nocardia cyriacigeorgica]